MKFGQRLFGRLFALKRSRFACLADFVLLYMSIVALATFLVLTGA
jgi:hypothetical protein